MKQVRAAATAGLLVTLLAGWGWAQKVAAKKKLPTSVRVSVTVHDPKGMPVSGAGVVLLQESVENGRLGAHPFNVELHTDSKGKITVQGFAPGIVLVQVIAKNYNTYGQSFVMEKADETVHVKLQAPQSQVSVIH